MVVDGSDEDFVDEFELGEFVGVVDAEVGCVFDELVSLFGF